MPDIDVELTPGRTVNLGVNTPTVDLSCDTPAVNITVNAAVVGGGGGGGGGGASSLDDLTDVTLTPADTGETLTYQAGAWRNAYASVSAPGLFDTNIAVAGAGFYDCGSFAGQRLRVRTSRNLVSSFIQTHSVGSLTVPAHTADYGLTFNTEYDLYLLLDDINGDLSTGVFLGGAGAFIVADTGPRVIPTSATDVTIGGVTGVRGNEVSEAIYDLFLPAGEVVDVGIDVRFVVSLVDLGGGCPTGTVFVNRLQAACESDPVPTTSW